MRSSWIDFISPGSFPALPFIKTIKLELDTPLDLAVQVIPAATKVLETLEVRFMDDFDEDTSPSVFCSRYNDGFETLGHLLAEGKVEKLVIILDIVMKGDTIYVKDMFEASAMDHLGGHGRVQFYWQEVQRRNSV